MAKELPYFKFEPNQWENGNIQMLSREDKGLFIDLCSMYWSRLGDVPLKLATQKLCAGNATAFKSLCDEKIIEILEGNIFIKFLSEQLNEFEDMSKQNSKNAKEGWEKRRKQKEESERNATALNSQCENDAIREDKRRKDNKKEDNNIEIFEAELISFSFDDFWELYPNKIGKKEAEKKFNKLTDKQKEKIEHHLPYFINHKPFKDYNHPHATTYLNQERYNDEIQINKNNEIKTPNNEQFTNYTTNARINNPRI